MYLIVVTNMIRIIRCCKCHWKAPLAVYLFSLSRALSLRNENKNKKISNSSLSKIYESVFEIFWDEGFIARNTVKTGQYLCSAVTFRKRSAIEMQFRDFFF